MIKDIFEKDKLKNNNNDLVSIIYIDYSYKIDNLSKFCSLRK